MVDSGFQVLRDSGFIVIGTCILESLISIRVFPDSEAKDSGLNKQFFCGFRNSSTGLPYLDNKYFFLIALHVRNIFACGIENPGLWDPEYSSRNPANDWNPESKFHLQRLRNQLFGIQNPWRGIQNPRLSWIPTEEKIDGNLPSACEEAFHLGDSREFTRELRSKGDESSRGRLSRLASHNW